MPLDLRDAPLHRLPVAPAPIHREVLGSYLNRLATANDLRFNRVVALLSLLPRPESFTPASDSTIGWTPAFPQRLATVTGRSLDHLTRALAALARRPVPDLAQLTPPISRACRSCAARRGAATDLVVVHAPARYHLCVRHRQWVRAPRDISLQQLSEVVEGQRRLDRLDRRHGATDTDQAFKAAQAIAQAWLHDLWHEPLLQRWNDRMSRIEELPASRALLDEHRVSIVTFPEVVTLTDVLLRSPSTTADPRTAYFSATTELATRLGFSYADRSPRDPFYLHLASAAGHRFGE